MLFELYPNGCSSASRDAELVRLRIPYQEEKPRAKDTDTPTSREKKQNLTVVNCSAILERKLGQGRLNRLAELGCLSDQTSTSTGLLTSESNCFNTNT